MGKYHIKIFVEHLDTNYKKLKLCLDSIQNQTYLQKSVVLLCSLKNYEKVFKFRTAYSTDIAAIDTNKFILNYIKDRVDIQYQNSTDLFVYITSNFTLEKNCLKNLINHYNKPVQMNIIPTPKNDTFPYGKIFKHIKNINDKNYTKVSTAIVYYQEDGPKWKKTLNSILIALRMRRNLKKKKLSI